MEKLAGESASPGIQAGAVTILTSLRWGTVLPFTSIVCYQRDATSGSVSHTTKYYKTMNTDTFVQVWLHIIHPHESKNKTTKTCTLTFQYKRGFRVNF